MVTSLLIDPLLLKTVFPILHYRERSISNIMTISRKFCILLSEILWLLWWISSFFTSSFLNVKLFTKSKLSLPVSCFKDTSFCFESLPLHRVKWRKNSSSPTSCHQSFYFLSLMLSFLLFDLQTHTALLHLSNKQTELFQTVHPSKLNLSFI